MWEDNAVLPSDSESSHKCSSLFFKSEESLSEFTKLEIEAMKLELSDFQDAIGFLYRIITLPIFYVPNQPLSLISVQ